MLLSLSTSPVFAAKISDLVRENGMDVKIYRPVDKNIKSITIKALKESKGGNVYDAEYVYYSGKTELSIIGDGLTDFEIFDGTKQTRFDELREKLKSDNISNAELKELVLKLLDKVL